MHRAEDRPLARGDMRPRRDERDDEGDRRGQGAGGAHHGGLIAGMMERTEDREHHWERVAERGADIPTKAILNTVLDDRATQHRRACRATQLERVTYFARVVLPRKRRRE